MSHMLSLPERLQRVAAISDLMLAGSMHAYGSCQARDAAHPADMTERQRMHYRPEPTHMHNPRTQRLRA